jgi:hypothetical protein
MASMAPGFNGKRIERKLLRGNDLRFFRAWPDGFIGVIDESGEDYLYPQEYFAPVTIEATAARELAESLPPRSPADAARMDRAVGKALRRLAPKRLSQ